MNQNKVKRMRRAKRGRMKIRELGATRLNVTRTPRHIYAQVTSADGGTVIAQASTLDKSLRDGATSNTDAASKVGSLIADRAKQAGVPAEDVAVLRQVFSAADASGRPLTAERSTLPVSSAASAAANRLLVVLPIAEHTRHGSMPSLAIKSWTRVHTSVILSASRTEEPESQFKHTMETVTYMNEFMNVPILLR